MDQERFEPAGAARASKVTDIQAAKVSRDPDERSWGLLLVAVLEKVKARPRRVSAQREVTEYSRKTTKVNPDGKPACAILLAGCLSLYSLAKEGMDMAEPQLSVRSARARDLAHRLARRENRSIADVVERALEAYEERAAGREPPAEFYARLKASGDADIDLETIIREGRQPHTGPEL